MRSRAWAARLRAGSRQRVCEGKTAWLNAHGLSMRRKAEITCKVGRDQRSWVREQKMNDLERTWQACWRGEGLDRKQGLRDVGAQGQASRQ